MKIAIIGAKGMLGQALVQVLSVHHQILAWDIDEIDITDRTETQRLVGGERPELIVNSAAFVDVEGCEADPGRAWLVNTVGAKNLALAAQGSDSALVQISTDYIFDGQTDKDYDEISRPNPLNAYGRSKLAAERLCLQVCSRTFVIRTAWLFGHVPNNYVERALKAAESGGVVRMPADQLESPTYTVHLAAAISHLVDASAYGVYNVTSIGACTRADFARYVLQQAGRPEQVEIADPSTLKRTTKRPPRVVLDCRLYQLVTGQMLPNWQQGVNDYLAAERRI